jgi:hypothetical protein
MAEPVVEFTVSRLFGLGSGIECGPQDTLDVPQTLRLDGLTRPTRS